MTSPSTALIQRPAIAIVGVAAGSDLPSYVTRDQARAIINAAETTMHRLLLETLWQSGGRVTEVLRLRPADLVMEEGALKLVNLKQRRRSQKQKLVYVSVELLSQLRQFARSALLRQTDAFFRSRESGRSPMSYEQCWRLIRHFGALAGVQVIGADGQLRPPNGRDFRHGTAYPARCKSEVA